MTTFVLRSCRNFREVQRRTTTPFFARLQNSATADLRPLEGLELERIYLPSKLKGIKGVEVLRDMKSLQRIETYNKIMSPGEFWEKYDKGDFTK